MRLCVEYYGPVDEWQVRDERTSFLVASAEKEDDARLIARVLADRKLHEQAGAMYRWMADDQRLHPAHKPWWSPHQGERDRILAACAKPGAKEGATEKAEPGAEPEPGAARGDTPSGLATVLYVNEELKREAWEANEELRREVWDTIAGRQDAIGELQERHDKEDAAADEQEGGGR